jgi:hypothetical protein
MQVQRVANFTPPLAPLKVLSDIAHVWRMLVASHMHSYRPEKHYMRGPGPKWREKHARNGSVARS